MAVSLTAEPLAVAHRATWADVVTDITTSTARRAGAGALWQRAGGVGVLTGVAPVVWVHGHVDAEDLLDTLRAAVDVREAYVEGTRTGVIAALQAAGWTTSEVRHELVRSSRSTTDVDAVDVVELGPADLGELRDLLRIGGADAAVLAGSYPDDFFTVAAPVHVLGAYDEEGRLVGSVAVRRQGRGALGFALCVDPGRRGTGLARGLVEAAAAKATDMDATFVHAQADDDCARLLRRCGFDHVGSWQRLVRP